MGKGADEQEGVGRDGRVSGKGQGRHGWRPRERLAARVSPWSDWRWVSWAAAPIGDEDER
jgi:hypothetical protein